MRTTVTRMHTPVHPGEFIRAEILEPLDLTVTAAAQVLQVSRPALSNLLNGQADQIFRDQMATAAAIDRLVHHSVLLEFDVSSFRLAPRRFRH